MRLRATWTWLVIGCLALPVTLRALPSNLHATFHHVWSQNAGWMNLTPGVPPGDGVRTTTMTISGTAWGQNIGWVTFGSGSPADGLRYSNTSASDCGVNVDCDGNLSGYAWSQNAGWINFGWAEVNDAHRPRMFFGSTPSFTGYAWSQTLGWIQLGAGWLVSTGLIPFADTDADGLPDDWEMARWNGLGTLDQNSDTDGDGMADSWEFTYFVALDVSNGVSDFDQDGRVDLEEFIGHSSPRSSTSVPSASGSTIASGAGKYVWSQNAGWLNFKHDQPLTPSGVIVREYFLSGRAWGQNLGWIDCGDGTPANGIRYGNTSPSDCGVNHDGAGNLSGYAWSQNAGWVNFGWTVNTHPNRARVALSSGDFKGYAWSQNLGWINLAVGLTTLSIDLADTDSDGLDDGWEREHFGNLMSASTLSDTDHDGQSDVLEFNGGTDPQDSGSLLRITAHSINAARNFATLSFTASATRQYRVSDSADLVNWVPTFLGWFIGTPNTAGTMTTFDPLASPQSSYFFRVEAKRPLTLSAP